MSGWISRLDARGSTTFIRYTEEELQLLVPPGARLGPPDTTGGGEGLWLWACWEAAAEPLIEHDFPTSCRRVRTRFVVAMLEDEPRREAEAIMREQLEHAWALCEPRPNRPIEDRRALAHAGLLMALTAEIREAFPTMRRWPRNPARTRAAQTTDFERLLAPAAQPGPARAESPLSTKLVLRALLRVLHERVQHGRGVTASRLLEILGRPTEPAAPPPPTVDRDAVVTRS